MKRTFAISIVFAILFTGQTAEAHAQVASAFRVIVLAQSPADTRTYLQIFCLFRSSPENTLHGSLTEIDGKLHGLLGQIRAPGLFGGELGETLLLTPPAGTLAAKKVLIIGLGDSQTYTPDRMYLVGKIALREANRLGGAHPYFAPTILDGGVTKFPPNDAAAQIVRGFRDAVATESALHAPLAVVDFTFLAGAQYAKDVQATIDRALKR